MHLQRRHSRDSAPVRGSNHRRPRPLKVRWRVIPMYDAFVAALLTVFATASTGAAVNPSATIIGTVTLTAADGGTFAAEGARIVLACERDQTARTEVADEHGTFRFLNVPVDRCSIEADVQGFVAPPVSVVTAADQIVATDLHLGIAPLRTGVNVRGTAPFQAPKRLSGSCRSDGRWRHERSAERCTRRVRQRRVAHS